MSGDVLFVHNNFPAQFRDLAVALRDRGARVAAIGSPGAPGLEGVPMARWSYDRGTTPGIFPLAVRAEADLIRGHAAYRAAQALKARGFEPRMIVGHPGWGETVLLSEVFPEARRVLFHEFFYRGRGSDIDFQQEFLPANEQALLTGAAKSAVMSLALAQADAIVTPTPFQKSTLPPVFHPITRVIHEGVDVAAIGSAPPAPVTLPDGLVLDGARPVITHINRHLEPMRGLHILLRALPALQAQVPDAQVVIVGEASARNYGGSAEDGRAWRDVILEPLAGRLDMDRVHFTGRLPHDQMLALLRLSWAHVYYTYPFVLSWSLCEAMAAGCYVIASDTAPVRDAIDDGVNGKVLPFLDVEALSDALVAACCAPEAYRPLRAAARRTAAERFDRPSGRKAWLALLDEVAGLWRTSG